MPLLLLYVYEDLMLKQLADSACVRRGWPSPASCFRLGCSCIHNACTKTPLAGSPSSLAIAWDKYGLSQPWKSHPRFPCCRVHPMSPLLSCLLYSVRREKLHSSSQACERETVLPVPPALPYLYAALPSHHHLRPSSLLFFFSKYIPHLPLVSFDSCPSPFLTLVLSSSAHAMRPSKAAGTSLYQVD